MTNWYGGYTAYKNAENKVVTDSYKTIIEIDKQMNKVEACYKACIHAASSTKHGCCQYTVNSSGDFHQCEFREADASTTYGTPLSDQSSSDPNSHSSYSWESGQKPSTTAMATLDPSSQTEVVTANNLMYTYFTYEARYQSGASAYALDTDFYFQHITLDSVQNCFNYCVANQKTSHHALCQYIETKVTST